jgi:hypothetical protein
VSWPDFVWPCVTQTRDIYGHYYVHADISNAYEEPSVTSGYYKISIRDDTAGYTRSSNYYAGLSHGSDMGYGVPPVLATHGHYYHVYIYSYLYVNHVWYHFNGGQGVANSPSVPEG